MQNKKIGIIVPIYNVEKYLKDCLDSVIHQSYKNLEIILINDGSTDTSLEIAKEYVHKDERIVLVDKINAGQSVARNLGIDIFSNAYKFKLSYKEENLNVFKILQNATIKQIYTLKKSLENYKIDGLIFLDSDDFWTLNCIEECVSKMPGADVVWFSYDLFYDGVQKPKKLGKAWLAKYGLKEGLIDTKTWLKQSILTKQKTFAFVVDGLIDFKFLQKIKLKFIEGIYAEDHCFGILLFMQASKIYVLPKVLYHYRIRANSSSNHITKIKLPLNLEHLYEDFGYDYEKVARYYESYNFGKVALALSEFLQKNEDRYSNKVLQNLFLPIYCVRALKVRKLGNDPLNLKAFEKDFKRFYKSKLAYKLWRFWARLWLG